MKLYIKQKVFSWGDKFVVKDETGADRYAAKGEVFSLGKKLHVLDAAGREVAFIRAKLLTLRNRYFIEIGGSTYSMRREWTLLKPRFSIEGLPWELGGDFFAHEYRITNNGNIIMSMSKHWFTWGDSYELDIPNPADELFCLCIALTIDCINADVARARS